MKTAVAWIAIIHFFIGLAAAIAGSLPAVIWCLGVIALLEWDCQNNDE